MKTAIQVKLKAVLFFFNKSIGKAINYAIKYAINYATSQTICRSTMRPKVELQIDASIEPTDSLLRLDNQQRKIRVLLIHQFFTIGCIKMIGCTNILKIMIIIGWTNL